MPLSNSHGDLAGRPAELARQLIDPHVAVVADDDVVNIKDRELSGHHATIAEQAAPPLAERYQTVAPVPCPAFRDADESGRRWSLSEPGDSVSAASTPHPRGGRLPLGFEVRSSIPGPPPGRSAR